MKTQKCQTPNRIERRNKPTGPPFRSWLAMALLILLPAGAAAQPFNKLYIMDNNADSELLYIISFTNPFDVGGSNVSIGSAIAMDDAFSADFRDIHVLSNGNLVVESVNANRLSYWNENGVYDSVSGQFGGNTSNGLTPLHNGTFLSKNTGTNNNYKVFNNGSTTEAYSGQLFEDNGSTGITSTLSSLAPRSIGGLIIGQGSASAQANVFTTSGSPGDTDLTAVETANMSPNPTDTRPIAQFPGGWAARGVGATWYAYSETTSGGSFPGITVNGTVGGRIVDVASFGLDHTAALFMNTGFAPTTSGNAYIQIWANSDLDGGPVRTIDLGFNLNTVSQNWNNSKLAGPMVIPEPGSLSLLSAILLLTVLVRRISWCCRKS